MRWCDSINRQVRLRPQKAKKEEMYFVQKWKKEIEKQSKNEKKEIKKKQKRICYHSQATRNVLYMWPKRVKMVNSKSVYVKCECWWKYFVFSFFFGNMLLTNGFNIMNAEISMLPWDGSSLIFTHFCIS